MKYISKFIIMIFSFSLVVALAACTSGNSNRSSSSQSNGKLKIAFIPQLIGIPYFTAMQTGGNKAAKKFGAQFIYSGATQASAQKQVQIMDSLIRQKVNALSVSVLDSSSINPEIAKAKKAGIKVYTSDSDSPTSERSLYVAQATDEDLGHTLIDRLAKQLDGKGEVGIVSGESTATNLNNWIKYMKERAKEKYPNLKIVEVRFTSGGSSEDAMKQAQQLMSKYPNIKGLVAVASSAVPGVAQAVQKANKKGKIAVIGYGSPKTVEPFIKSGVMKESILWNAEDLGYLTVWAGIQLTKGKNFKKINHVPGLSKPVKYFSKSKILLLGPPLIINKENVNYYSF
jgi:rhamnose transport system substrate-binding protein